ncbi:MAG: hypothetical protein ABI462_03620 [Ignavibacteria bacterium]
MKKIIVALVVILMSSTLSHAQFKEPEKTPSYKSTGNLILGFINPNNFTMNHSFNVSMISTGYGNVSLTSYVNSMNYKISDRFNVSADVKFQYSPFASSKFGTSNSTALQNNLSGLFLSRASLNYKISDNSFINFEYRRYDESDYLNDFHNPFHPNSGYSGY